MRKYFGAGFIAMIFLMAGMLAVPAFAADEGDNFDKKMDLLEEQELKLNARQAEIGARQAEIREQKAFLQFQKKQLEKSAGSVSAGQEGAGATATTAPPLNFEATGFVDMSLYSDMNAGSRGMALDQVEIDVVSKKGEKSSARFDIESSGDGTLSMEQGYMEIYLAEGYTFTFGKFNAPIGFELLDAPDMFQYSHAMVFNYGLPTNLTGAKLSAGFGITDVALYYANGWDLNSDDNKEKTIGIRVGVTPNEAANVGLSYIGGKEGATPLNLAVTDIDFTYKGIPDITIGAEYNIGAHEGSSAVTAGNDAKWSGYLLMVNYAINDAYAVTFRYDAFDDKDGARLGGGVKETRNSITLSPSFAIADGFGGLVEYKMTTSDQEVFTDSGGNPKKTMNEFAAELTYKF